MIEMEVEEVLGSEMSDRRKSSVSASGDGKDNAQTSMTQLLNIEEVEETSRVEDEPNLFGEGADTAVLALRQSMHQ